MKSLAALIVIAAAMACSADAPPPRNQAVIVIDTDAPVPRMMDRLRIELFDASMKPCVGCAREVEATAATFPASFGVVAPSVAYARIRLFLGGRAIAGDPAPPTTIDRLIAIRRGPGVARQRVLLTLDCAGVAADLDNKTSCASLKHVASIDEPLQSDDGSKSLAGSWHAEVTTACVGAPKSPSRKFEDELCVRGGVYWMGDARTQANAASHPEHAVAVKPFFVDKYEVSVARYRDDVSKGLALKLFVRVNSTPVVASCNNYDQTSPTNPALDAMPLNCLNSRTDAASLCAFEGKRLPTEAEWEWAAGNRERETLYPWGDTTRPCSATHACPSDTVVNYQYFGKPLDVASDDVTDDGVMDMGEDLAEWVADEFERYGQGCWALGAYGPSPRCTLGSDTSLRGGAFADARFDALPFALAPARRTSTIGSGVGMAAFGVRCARDDAH